ncbi:MAG: hypothetical protein ABEJ67_03770 [Halanaeroarchaeum sp.]
MTGPERSATVAKLLAAALAVLGLWTAVAPVVIGGGETVVVPIVGGLIAVLATGYLIQLHRTPETKLASLWYVLVLGVLLLSGAVLAPTPGSIYYWSTLLTSILVLVLATLSLLWGSRFVASSDAATTIFEK